MATRPLQPGDSAFSASAFEGHLDERLPSPWVGWRRGLLVGVTLLACLGLLLLTRWAALAPHLDLRLQALPQGGLALVGIDGSQTGHPLLGSRVVGIDAAGRQQVELDTLALQRSPRWQVDDATRERQVAQQERLAELLSASDAPRLLLGDGRSIPMAATPRGVAGLGLLYWPLSTLALALLVVGAAALLLRPQLPNLLFALMAWCQSGNLWFVALQSGSGLGLPAGSSEVEPLLRMAFDLATAAAAVHALCLYPRRLPGADAIAGAAWTAVLLLLMLAQAGTLPHIWWWTQATLLSFGGATLALATWSVRLEANPFAAVLRRLGIASLVTLALVTAGVAAAAADDPGATPAVAAFGITVWHVFFASLLLLVPFLSRSKQLLREFAMLAGVSTVATSLDLLFVALFSLGPFTSLALAVFIALGLYAGARQWLLSQIVGGNVMTTERTFEQLYRVARELQEQPARYAALLTQLLRDLFDPLEVLRVERPTSVSRVIAGGSALVVPVRRGAPDDSTRRPLSLVLRFARRGQRLFTADDARLADRIVEQLRRAVAYDKAVERGRNEERLRIAQDLHDDIGARLLTLMYQAQSPEMEEYLRQTLKDLKTLTRGLAASEHRLSHAAAEWKADLTQRLTAAHVQLGWTFDYDRDARLSMAQWSALTRVLRELASNALYHAQASRVDISFVLAGTTLALSVADDGRGRDPSSWSHGLGLGGVRKRVKGLGGEVRWRENTPRGIVCEVRVPQFLVRE